MARSSAARKSQLEFVFEPDAPPQKLANGRRAIESADFPFEVLSDIAEAESWRKEINRPLSHIHKWWAQRLGSVFRAVVLGTLADDKSDVMQLFYTSARFPNATVFDPFMGSGTTVVEALKVGANAIGRDINPVAHFLVKNAVAIHGRKDVQATFRAIERDVAEQLQSLYIARLADGTQVPVLYYFWVKQLSCPECSTLVDLFSSRVFARHAYAKKFPESQATCPHCGGINVVRFDAEEAICSSCEEHFDPSHGPAHGQKATCPTCDHEFSIARTTRAHSEPPSHRLYAKLVLLPDGSKKYLAADDFDLALIERTRARLEANPDYPLARIESGTNTDQALGYNYRHWFQFFNERQLLALSILGERIRQIPQPALRDLFVCLFSGALEFNNMFASYKGEGTGAVRHMFSHHILKPERTPLEANLWGTPKSSGSFSTMFASRILRALEYAEDPFELKIEAQRAAKVYGLSLPLGGDVATTFAEFGGKGVYLSCGDSSKTDIASRSVDAVITDPPFFDNVNYSQLADFFNVWQRHILRDNSRAESTRSHGEVQHGDEEVFRDRLGEVWAECHRVLKDDGLMVFSYHHSRTEGWRAVLEALMTSGFVVVAAQPVKAEMSVAMPKLQAKEPIDLDILVVCRKANAKTETGSWGEAVLEARHQVMRFIQTGRRLSRNDVRIIVMGQLLRPLSHLAQDTALARLAEYEANLEAVISKLHGMQP